MPKSVSFQVNSVLFVFGSVAVMSRPYSTHNTLVSASNSVNLSAEEPERGGGQKERVKVNLRQQHIHWRMRGFLDALYYHINSKGAFVRSIFAGTSAV